MTFTADAELPINFTPSGHLPKSAARRQFARTKARREEVRQGRVGCQPGEPHHHRQDRERALQGVLDRGARSRSDLGLLGAPTDRSCEAVIWRTCLYAAWPKGTNHAELQPPRRHPARAQPHSAQREAVRPEKRPALPEEGLTPTPCVCWGRCSRRRRSTCVGTRT